MRLENLPSQGVTDGSRTSATRAASPEIGTGHMQFPKGGTTDQVDLSGASSLLGLSKSVSSDRQGKVQALAAQYAAGTYKPDAAAISRSLIDSLKN